MDLKITGLEQVQRALAELPREMVSTGFGVALDQAAGVIGGHVAARAAGLRDASDTPLSEHVRVATQVAQGAGGRVAGIASIGFDSSQDERTGIPQDLKALLVEYGHRMIGHKPDKKQLTGPKTPSGQVQPQPFMRPAVEESWEQAVRVFGDTLVDALSGIVEKA